MGDKDLPHSQKIIIRITRLQVSVGVFKVGQRESMGCLILACSLIGEQLPDLKEMFYFWGKSGNNNHYERSVYFDASSSLKLYGGRAARYNQR